MRPARVVSGGQTGADRAALDAAVTVGLPYGGWCPPGGWAEDLSEPPGLLASYPSLVETPGTDRSTRTDWNVRDSDATLVLHLAPLGSPGTDRTVGVARRLGRPLLVARADDLEAVASWLGSVDSSRSGTGSGWTLNVAGPRESEDPGLYAVAYRTLCRLLEAG